MLGGDLAQKLGWKGVMLLGGVSLSPGLCWRKGDRVGRGTSEGWGGHRVSPRHREVLLLRGIHRANRRQD